MGIQAIIYVVLILGGVIFAAFLFMADNAWDSLSDWAFTRAGWSSGRGPLVVVAERHGDKLALTMQNQGRARMKLAAVEGRDGRNQRHLPTPCIAEHDQDVIPTAERALARFSKIVLEPQGSQIVNLRVADLLALGVSSLAIIDSNGKSWPVQRFNAAEMHRPG